MRTISCSGPHPSPAPKVGFRATDMTTRNRDPNTLEGEIDDNESVTAVLESSVKDLRAGERILDRLMPLVYDELRILARGQLARERDRVTLQTTGLVHEAYIRLVDQSRVSARGRAYFFGSAARAMRQVLVDAARRRNRLKRGAGQRPLTLEETLLKTDDFAVEILEIEDVLNQFSEDYPRQARVVECRFFGGLTVKETAEALEVSERTVKGDWALARAWLFDAIKGPE